MHKQKNWTLASGGIAIFVGATLSQIFAYITKNEFSFAPLVGSIPITLILIIINIIMIKSNKNDQ
ncbi:hypothetical protein P5G51_001990 [Virgibacillus sp. 179-BFC.A HS]|uniref:DUF3098 domain-containing protein n=1 Tax=Tigheibacillus jepli TaxID=3035914 RepID=A0ABU5CDD0_9BACI|nr:hypothetical protein [Virgibacillus sp. 179-BFC.A HS]MDY0404347.1 hypothetical protein [Virgibacillus sp. 179-BFC.A HS]